MKLPGSCVETLVEFERHLDPGFPERGKIPARILGCGEISTVFEIPSQGDLAFKRMPIFKSREELLRYEEIYRRYNEVLAKDIGIRVPEYDSVNFIDKHGRIIYFIVQEKLPSDFIGSRLIHRLDPDGVTALLLAVLGEIKKVMDFNRENAGRLEVAVDGQISNWALAGPGEPGAGPGGFKLMYIDTSTPLIRIDGGERLNPELFLRSAPSFLVWIIRKLFLKDIMNRYYDFRLVTVDLLANFFKEQQPGLIPGLIRAANEFFAREAPHFGIKPITFGEVKAYYREDALIWRLYLSFRKADRFLHRLAGKRYPYILPGKIKR